MHSGTPSRPSVPPGGPPEASRRDPLVGYQPLDGTGSPRRRQPAAEHLHLRVERETLRRLAATGAVAFTIRTFIRRFDELAAEPDDAARLRDALEALPPEVADYKGLSGLGPVAIRCLESVVAAH
jgi:hypothetical protein